MDLFPETPHTGAQGIPCSGWSTEVVYQEILWPASATLTPASWGPGQLGSFSVFFKSLP